MGTVPDALETSGLTRHPGSRGPLTLTQTATLPEGNGCSLVGVLVRARGRLDAAVGRGAPGRAQTQGPGRSATRLVDRMNMSQPTNPPPAPPHDETTLADVKQLGLWAAIASLSYVFWVVGGMEMVERLAFYGVRAVATLYATRPESTGGLGVTMATFGTLLLFWNLVQSLIPVFTGGLSDRYGYKQTIFASTVIKSLGYLVMAWFHSYWGFFAGAMLLATGTAIFKPGVQGTLIKATNRRNSSMAWGIFYQTVNIGGWIGPLIALQMRLMDWKYVFYTNAGVICCNFLLLLTYREPGKAERLARQERLRAGAEPQRSLALEALGELKKPHLALYLGIFSVWWLMFPMLWDVLPKYIEDWVNTAPMVQFLFGAGGAHSGFWKFFLGMDANGQTIQPEGIVNINAGMIMLTCFLYGAAAGARNAGHAAPGGCERRR